MDNFKLDFVYQILKERYQDLIDQAEQERLICAARCSQVTYSSFYRRFLCWLGYRLIAWGHSLLKGYESLQGDLSTSELSLAK
jgi:hypothetical protein